MRLSHLLSLLITIQTFLLVNVLLQRQLVIDYLLQIHLVVHIQIHLDCRHLDSNA